MNDYKKIEDSHSLSKIKILIPHWSGISSVRTPFSAWATKGKLNWYDAYNKTKHDRHEKFHLATFDNLINSISGLVSVLASQFYTRDFSPVDYMTTNGGGTPGYEACIGSYFQMKMPQWLHGERYGFTYQEWEILAAKPDPFNNYPYPYP